jgi:hypothetical protein
LYHLRRVAAYIGPYQRGIDPAINVGPCESKYPLHSRFMHYFSPPVQAMASLAAGRTIRGKFESLGLARDLLPRPQVIDMVLDSVACHYEQPESYREPRLSEIERALAGYLVEAWASLAGRTTLVQPEAGHGPDDVRRKVAAVAADPAAAFFEGVKYARFMKGRLLFYADDITWFDSIWLIRNELGRIAANFCLKPLQTYGRVRFGVALPWEQVLDRLHGGLLLANECAAMREFARVAGGLVADGGEKQRAREVAAVFEPVVATLEKLGADLLQYLGEPCQEAAS